MTINKMIFVLVNWVELSYLYKKYRDLRSLARRDKLKNQLNIYTEMLVSTCFWGFTSFVYFISQLNSEGVDQSSADQFRLAVFIGIQARNMMTFLATTLPALFQSKFEREGQFNNDKKVVTKISILSLDVIMTHSMPF